MSSIAVIGTGYVGLTTAACLADLGHQVIALDIDQTKIATLKKGKPTIYEPGLDEVMSRAIKSSRLRFTSDYGEAIPEADQRAQDGDLFGPSPGFPSLFRPSPSQFRPAAT